MTAFTRRDFPDGAALAPAFAQWTADRLVAGIAARGAAPLIVSGGRTPSRFFRALSNQPIDWSRVAVTLADERRVADDSPRSNAKLVREALLKGRAAVAQFVPLADVRLTKPRNSPQPMRGSSTCPCPPTSSRSAWATTATPPHGSPAPTGSPKRWTRPRARWSRRSAPRARRSRA